MHERLAELIFDLCTLDLAGFRRWLDVQTALCWANDPVFVQRSRIRELRQAHPELHILEADQRRAIDADAASEFGPRLNAIEKQLVDVDHAIVGLGEAMSRVDAEKRPSLDAKRIAFVERRKQLEAEHDDLTARSPERRALLQAADSLDRLRETIGLDREDAHLAELQTAHGRRSSRAGAVFEEEALALTRSRIVPELTANDVHVLQSVRLGAAGVDLDIVVVRRTGGPDDPVEVLALVEAKRNINDLGHGFRRRQIDLAWLTGDRAAYDAVEHRTGFFTSGHFDRPAAHWQDGHAFVFAPESFRRFHRGPKGHFIAGLYLVTRAGPIRGLSGAALSRVAARVATDERSGPDDAAYPSRLFDWAQSLAGPIETPEVLDIYTAFPKQLVVIEP